ncbi:MAG: hypothetical protein IKS90_06845 [Clostridia bacterium]|nr:hypothetical protein [Clostridia bacterium]
MNDPNLEALWFYTAADYLLINAFLWRNTEALAPCLELVYNNNLSVIQEVEKLTPEKRFAFTGFDCNALYEVYKRRTPFSLTAFSKRKMLEQAIDDIRTICSAAMPVSEDLLLFRNVNARFMLNAEQNDTVALLGLTSTSNTGQLIDYGNNDYLSPAQILKICVPRHFPAVSFVNSENEVILPPMEYRVLSSTMRDNVSIIELQAIGSLDIESLISTSKDVFSEYFYNEQ